MIEQPINAGDTFPVVYKHMPNGVLEDLPEGYDYMIGLRPEDGKTVTTFSYRNNDIESRETGIYRWSCPHELSKSLKGNVVLEMVIYSRDLKFVRHCSEPVLLKVNPSFMNDYLDHE
jgi:hypothetical protein